jgi:hypothetical protein
MEHMHRARKHELKPNLFYVKETLDSEYIIQNPEIVLLDSRLPRWHGIFQVSRQESVQRHSMGSGVDTGVARSFLERDELDKAKEGGKRILGLCATEQRKRIDEVETTMVMSHYLRLDRRA